MNKLLSDEQLALVRVALSRSPSDWRSRLSLAEQAGLLARLDAAEAQRNRYREALERIAARDMHAAATQIAKNALRGAAEESQ